MTQRYNPEPKMTQDKLSTFGAAGVSMTTDQIIEAQRQRIQELENEFKILAAKHKEVIELSEKLKQDVQAGEEFLNRALASLASKQEALYAQANELVAARKAKDASVHAEMCAHEKVATLEDRLDALLIAIKVKDDALGKFIMADEAENDDDYYRALEAAIAALGQTRVI